MKAIQWIYLGFVLTPCGIGMTGDININLGIRLLGPIISLTGMIFILEGLLLIAMEERQ